MTQGNDKAVPTTEWDEERALFVQHQLPKCITDARLQVLAANETLVELLGLTRDRIMERPLVEVCRDDGRPLLEELQAAALKADSSHVVLVRRAGGVEISVELSVRHIQFRGTSAWLLLWHDRTPLVAAERVRSRAETTLQAVLAGAPVVVFACDRDGFVTIAEGRGLEMLGFDAGALVGRCVFDRVWDERVPLLVRRALNGETFRTLVPFNKLTFETHCAPLRDESGAITGATAVANDVTERVTVERRLVQQTAHHEALLQAQSDLGEGIVVVDMEKQRVTFVNDAFCRISGYTREELEGLASFLDVIPQPHRDMMRERLGQRIAGRSEADHYETRLMHKDGRTLDIEVAIKAVADQGKDSALGIVRDVTDRKLAQKAMLDAQRMESLSTLAGGIAHGFNNILSIILGNVGMANAQVGLDSPLREWLRAIESAGMRAADIGQQMLAYSGRARFDVARVQLGLLLGEMRGRLGLALPANVHLVLDIEDALPEVDVDAAQMRQLIINLVLNGAESLEGREGRVAVSLRRVELGPEYLKQTVPPSVLEPGTYLRLTVADNGRGIAPAIVPRIFDPFFTTKFAGRGLGLAAALGIVRSHYGAFHVESTPGAGSCLSVVLPMSHAPRAEEQAAEPAGAEAAAQKLVVVADDEEGVRMVVAKILERHGYRVVGAEDGKQAIELFNAHRESVVAVVLDMTMPVVSGEEALREIRRLSSGMPVLLMSGYNDEESAIRLSHTGPTAFIRKPFMPDDLRERLRVLVGPAAA